MILLQICIPILIKYAPNFLFSPGCDLQIVRDKFSEMIRFMKPDIGMKAFKVNIKYFLLVAHNLFELLKFDFIFIFIKVEALENINSILFY